jgi:hypothetical protein
MRMNDWCRTLLPRERAHRSPKSRHRLTWRFFPRVELLELRLTPSGIVLQTPIPLVPSQDYQAAGYTATLSQPFFLPGPSGGSNANSKAFQNIATGQGTPILTNTDDAFVQVPLGFNFTFFGIQYNQVWVTSNGLMTFSSLASDTGYTDYAGTDLTANVGPNRPIIAPLWDDWVVTGPGNVYYATLGNPGSQEFIVQWDQVQGYPTSPNTVTFEVALFQADNHIEFRYGNVVAGTSGQSNIHDNGMNATIGIRSGFPGVTAGVMDASGGGAVPDGVGGIQIGNDGGPSHQAVIQNGSTITFTPDVPPTALALSNHTILDTSPVGTVVGTFATADADSPNDSFSYSLVNGSGPNNNSLFTIVGDQLETNSVLTSSPQTQYTVLVQTTNLGGESFDQQFTINVTQVKLPPVITSGQTFSVTQGTPLGAVIGSISATDPNTFQKPPGVLTYSTTSTVFAVDPNTGQITVADPSAIDITTAASFNVPITVSDNSNPPLSTNGSVTVNVIQVPLTASITGVPTTVQEGTAVSLSSLVSDSNGQSQTYSWTVTRNGAPISVSGPTNGPTLDFTPTLAGTYAVTLTVTDQRGQSVAPTALVPVTAVPPVVNVGSENTITSTDLAITRSISFTALNPGALVSIDFGDGTRQTFPLSAGSNGFDPATNTFTLQHLFTTTGTFTVTVSVTDAEGVTGSAQFPVAVYDPAEFARIVAFAVGIADSAGTAQVNLSTPSGSAVLNGTLTGASPGDSLALTVFNGNPEPDNFLGQTDGGALLPVGSGGPAVDTATPLEFVDTRAEAPSTAVVNESYQFTVPTSLLHGGLQLYWFNKGLGIWEAVNGQDASDGNVQVTPILGSDGQPTGFSLITFSETYGPGSSPSTSHLDGTVFSIAIPAGNVGTTQTVVFPAQLAGPTTGVSVLTTGFSSGSNLTLSLQESQSGLLLAGLVGTHTPGDAPGEVDDGVPAGGDDQLLNWLVNGWLWNDRRQTRPDGESPPPPAANQQPQPPAVSQHPGNAPQEMDDQAIDMLFSTAPEFTPVTRWPSQPLPATDAEPVVESFDTQPSLAAGVVLAGATLSLPKRYHRRLGFTRIR